MMDILSVQGIRELLSDNLKDKIRTELPGETDSTNTIIKQRAARGENEGLFVVAERQTGGRGRLGRSFFSPERTGI